MKIWFNIVDRILDFVLGACTSVTTWADLNSACSGGSCETILVGKPANMCLMTAMDCAAYDKHSDTCPTGVVANYPTAAQPTCSVLHPDPPKPENQCCLQPSSSEDCRTPVQDQCSDYSSATDCATPAAVALPCTWESTACMCFPPVVPKTSIIACSVYSRGATTASCTATDSPPCLATTTCYLDGAVCTLATECSDFKSGTTCNAAKIVSAGAEPDGNSCEWATDTEFCFRKVDENFK